MLSFNKQIKIQDSLISPDTKSFIIAEAGVNHNGEMKLAKQLVDIAFEAQVDAVKFQSFKTESLILKSVEKAAYQKETTGSDASQFEMLKKLEFSVDQMAELQNYCTQKGIVFLTTPFDEDSLQELDALNLPAYKISSTDLTNISFVTKVAEKGKPFILSTGMSYMEEISEVLAAVETINQNVILLQCTGNYPTEPSEVNLNVLETYQKEFDMLIGFSDHTAGIGASPYAVAKGSKVIEKHFTIDKNMDGPDHRASLDPVELTQLVKEIRMVESYMGSATKSPTATEEGTRNLLQKCLVASKNITKGDVFSPDNIISKRTGGEGIPAFKYNDIIGKIACDIFYKDDIITLEP